MKRILIFLLIIVCVFSLFSCDFIKGIIPGGILPEGWFSKDNDDNALQEDFTLEGYRIVYPSSADKTTISAANKLKTYLEELTGFKFEVIDDTTETVEKEILVGNTNREASKKYSIYLPNDYAVEMNGTYIIIAGGSGSSILKSIDYFKSKYFDKNAKNITLDPKNGYVYRHAYKEILIGSSDISYFSIVADEKTLTYAEQLNITLLDRCGVTLPIITDKSTLGSGERIIEFIIDYTRFNSKYQIDVQGNTLTIGAPSELGMEKRFPNS